jgi:hypothetical protein
MASDRMNLIKVTALSRFPPQVLKAIKLVILKVFRQRFYDSKRTNEPRSRNWDGAAQPGMPYCPVPLCLNYKLPEFGR